MKTGSADLFVDSTQYGSIRLYDVIKDITRRNNNKPVLLVWFIARNVGNLASDDG